MKGKRRDVLATCPEISLMRCWAKLLGENQVEKRSPGAYLPQRSLPLHSEGVGFLEGQTPGPELQSPLPRRQRGACDRIRAGRVS